MRLPRVPLALALALSLAFASGRGVSAQERSGPAPRLADLDDASLLARATTAAARLADAEKTLDLEQKTLAAGSEQLRENEGRTASLRIPDEKPPAPADPSALGIAKAAQDAAAARLDALRTRQKLLEDDRALLEERAKHLESARAALEGISAALDEAEPIAAELDVRVAAKRIAAEKLSAPIATASLRGRRASLAAADASRQRDAAAVREDLASLAPRIAAAREDTRATEKALARATRAQDEQKRRDAIEKELDDRDPPALSALLSTAAVDRDRLVQALEPPRLAFEKARDDVAAAEADLAREPAPDADKVAVDSAPARVMNAQRTFNLVGLLADFQRRRSERLGALATALGKLNEKAAVATASASALDAVLLRMSVIARVLEKRRGDPPNASIEDERRSVAALADAAADAASSARRRGPQVEREITEALALEKTQRDKLPPLKSAYEQAKANARWTREVEQLPTPDVLRRFIDAREQSRAADAAVASARLRFSDAEAAVVSGTLALQSLDDPPSRRAREENAEERRRILAALAKVAGQPLPADASADGVARTPDPLANAATGTSTTPAKGSEALAQEIEAGESTLAGRARALEEQAPRLEAKVSLLAGAESAAAALARALGEQSSETQRAYGSALELETRLGLGELPADQLPAGVSDSVSYDRLASIESDLTTAQAAQASFKAQRERCSAQRDDAAKLRKLVDQAIAIRGKMVELLRQRAAREAAYERAQGALPDNEKRRRDQEVLRRLESEDGSQETVLGIFTNDRAAAITELLRSDYGDLLELERKRTSLDERSRLTTDLLSIAEEERKNDAARLPIAQRRLVQDRADDAAARIRAGIVAPQDATALAALQADGETPPAAEPVAANDLAATADRIFLSRARAIAAETLVRELEQRLSASGIDREKGARQDELGELATRADTVEREKERVAAEVAQTRSLRRRVLERAAAGAVARLLLIPLVAFAIIRAMHALGARIVKRAHGDGAGTSPDREHRAQTIVNVFTRAWAGLVATVAGAYMLKELKIDVTPILASAGVVGLAIAFGAQALIRDYLAGFFILLEDQYKIGDTVRIGDSTGIVERVTLRLTVLRAADGTVFYIPNGNVQLVANMTREWANATLKVAVGYDADLDHVTAVLKQVGKELDDDELFGGKILEPPQVLGIEDFGDEGISISMLYRTLPNEQVVVLREARLRIKKAFDRERIGMPLPTEVVHHVYPPETPPEKPRGAS
jgi:small conductance mechanosensitive channel